MIKVLKFKLDFYKNCKDLLYEVILLIKFFFFFNGRNGNVLDNNIFHWNFKFIQIWKECEISKDFEEF